MFPDERVDVRFIPAYAGSTAPCSRRRGGTWDHPRVCGEHQYLDRETVLRKGSSPRMRGALGLVRDELHDGGIIPAYAGSTSTPHSSCHRAWDHPRVCGEHEASDFEYQVSEGSSPRMRGALQSLATGLEKSRIIPAYAGSTLAAHSSR